MAIYGWLFLALLFSALSAPALACSQNKLDLDWCGAQERTKPEPLNKLDFGKETSRPSQDPSLTIVTPRDSSGKELKGPGVKIPFGGK